MQDVTDGAAGRIVAHEGEETDLANGEGAELRLKALWNSVRHGPRNFRKMMEHQVNDCFGARPFSICEMFGVPFVELVADVFVHFHSIPTRHCLMDEVQVFE